MHSIYGEVGWGIQNSRKLKYNQIFWINLSVYEGYSNDNGKRARVELLAYQKNKRSSGWAQIGQRRALIKLL